MSANANQSCKQNLIAAYIDGELDSKERLLVERHLVDCEQCQQDLRAYQMFVCELDAALMPVNVPVPSDFSRQIAVRAASDMSGIRSTSENKKAAAFCAVLALAALALLSDTARLAVLNAAQQVARMVVGTIFLFMTALYDVLTSIAVISRVLGSKLMVESNSPALLLVLFALAVLLLSRMIVNYHRPRV